MDQDKYIVGAIAHPCKGSSQTSVSGTPEYTTEAVHTELPGQGCSLSGSPTWPNKDDEVRECMQKEKKKRNFGGVMLVH